MSHNLGRLVTRGTRIGPDSGSPATAPNVWTYQFTADAAPLGGSPRFVFLHFSGAALPAGAWLEVNLGYSTDQFNASSGGSFWTRPFNPVAGVGQITFHGSTGGVTLEAYGSGEPAIAGVPGAALGSQSNPDIFLQTNPYQEPTYETRLMCGVFDWQEAAVASTPAEIAAMQATGIIVSVYRHDGKIIVSSCTGTLIAPDLFLTAHHCASEPDLLDVVSASVTFDYQTTTSGTTPAGYGPRFHKVTRVVSQGDYGDYSIDHDWIIVQIATPAGGLGIAPRPLRSTAPVAGESILTIHHPGGAVKKLQRGTLSSSDVRSILGMDYAGGSSGSALFDASGQILGAALSAGPLLSDPCRVGYCPARSVLDQLANPPVPSTPFDVMLVIDRSGSMAAQAGGGLTKMQHAAEAGSLFASLVRTSGGDRIGMNSFSSTATSPPDIALTAVNPALKTLVSNRLHALSPGGSTSIGGGLQVAADALNGTSNQASVLLLTDGLQNTQPWIADVEAKLGNAKVFAIGFGSDADLDGPLLTKLARDHRGLYARAGDGLALRKFFALCFGNIFEAGMLADPPAVLPNGEHEAKVLVFDACDEEQLTIVFGWESPLTSVYPTLIAPDGTLIDASSPGAVSDLGPTWSYLRVPLPQNGNRGGQWTVISNRSDFERVPGEVNFNVSVIAAGGPKLMPLPPDDIVRVGDPLPIRLGLRYPDGTVPHAEVQIQMVAPDRALGDLVADWGLVNPPAGSDPLSPWHATLAEIAAANGGTLPIGTIEQTLSAIDEGEPLDGAMEPDGIYAGEIANVTKVEGTYSFHAIARYSDDGGCTSTREAMWSIYVHPQVDPDSSITGVEVPPGTGEDERGYHRFTIEPRDVYGNRLGPGRLSHEDFTVGEGAWIRRMVDVGDGTYQVYVARASQSNEAPSIGFSFQGGAPVQLKPTSRAAD